MLEETAEGLIYNPLSQSTFAFRQGPSGDGPTGAAEHLGLPSSLPLKRRALGWAMRGGCRSCWVSCWPFSAPCLLCRNVACGPFASNPVLSVLKMLIYPLLPHPLQELGEQCRASSLWLMAPFRREAGQWMVPLQLSLISLMDPNYPCPACGFSPGPIC